MRRPPRGGVREQRVFIFDGPDGCGKTSIAQALGMKLDIPYFRMPTQHENWRRGSFVDALRFDQTYLVELLRQTGYELILDRAYPAEWVYSQVFGRETDTETLERVDDAMSDLGAYIVIPVRRDYSDVRRDELVPADLLPRIHEKYAEFASWTRCPTVTVYVDDFGNDLKREIDVILPEISQGDAREWVCHVTLSREVRKVDVGKLRPRWSPRRSET